MTEGFGSFIQVKHILTILPTLFFSHDMKIIFSNNHKFLIFKKSEHMRLYAILK